LRKKAGWHNQTLKRIILISSGRPERSARPGDRIGTEMESHCIYCKISREANWKQC
jgi:hypothetical protein